MSAASDRIALDPALVALFRPRKWYGKAAGEGRAAAGRSSRSATARGRTRPGAAELIHNAYGVPQAVIKVTRQGHTRGGNELRSQLQYIARSGEVPLTDRFGQTYAPGASGRHHALVADWQRDFELMDPRTGFFTYHLVISYPEGTDSDAAARAAEAFAEELTGGDYGDRWKYALAHHRDTRYPHSHLVLNRRGTQGRTLHISRHGITVQDLRALHVETAAREAIALNATSRASRNVQHRPSSSGRIHAVKEGRALAPRPEPKPEPRATFPFHGAGHRPDVTQHGPTAAHAGALARLAKDVRGAQHRSLMGGIDAGSVAERLDHAAGALRRNAPLRSEPGGVSPPTLSALGALSQRIRDRLSGLWRLAQQDTGSKPEHRATFERAARALASLMSGTDRADLEAEIPPLAREEPARHGSIAGRLAGIVERGRSTAPPERAQERESGLLPGPSIEERLKALREPRHAAPAREPPARQADPSGAKRGAEDARKPKSCDLDRDDGLDR